MRTLTSRHAISRKLFSHCTVHIYHPVITSNFQICEKSFKEGNSDESLQAAVKEHFTGKNKHYFFYGIEKLIKRCKKCIDVRGDYIEKLK